MDANVYDPIAAALREDIGEGDITTEFFVPATLHASARVIAREKAIVAGTKTAADVFRRIDSTIRLQIVRADGSEVNVGEAIIEIHGSARSILKGERVALNFLQRLCGIATLTRKFVEAAGTERVKILDTRKTAPGLRALEKAAVIAGGGANHRFGLFDMVLVKDNHLVADSGLAAFAKTVRKIRKERPGMRIEVEADRLDQVRALIEMDDIDVILLDNMTPGQMREAVALGKTVGRDRRGRRERRIKFEASGGVTLKNIRRIAATGVDYISVGALTHSAPAINLSLEIKDVGT
jgi:nicotinate-nucleotide pyrophosphorylase (carboxylating)